jgi:hypothetical protein
LIDTDVLLDVGLAREPYAAASAAVLRWAELDRTAAVAWHSLPNCAYVLKGAARTYLVYLLEIVTVAPVSLTDARRALSLPMADIEDAFQAAAALAWRADCIVTRNVQDYQRSPVPALSPTTFLQQLK